MDNEVICNCGKKGCLETEASGYAVERILKERLEQGSTTICVMAENERLEAHRNAVIVRLETLKQDETI